MHLTVLSFGETWVESGFHFKKGAVKEIPLLFTFINERNYIAKTFNVTIRFELGIFLYFL